MADKNIFAALRPDEEEDEGGSSGSSDDSYLTAPEFPPRHRSPAPAAAAPVPVPAPAPSTTRRSPPPPDSSKHLSVRELVPGRIIYVRNPTGERSWRGHPGIILNVQGGKARVITLTSWAGKTCEQKWCHSEDPVRYRRWFMLVDDGSGAPNHDGVPVVRLRRGKSMPKLCYVDCKRTHWLDVSEMEKYRVGGGDTHFWVTQQSTALIKKHLMSLEKVETPWVDAVVPQQRPWVPTEVKAVAGAW